MSETKMSMRHLMSLSFMLMIHNLLLEVSVSSNYDVNELVAVFLQ